jgi:subtilisin-like proprotein convertase family protein
VNIRLTNNIWGGGAFSQALSDAIAASGNAGMLFVVAAGNNASNNDTTPFYPASYNLPNVVVVAATDQNDALASFSNYGATSVDLAAPGVSILSTTPNNTYSSLSGTSMATPHVSGVAALAWSLVPGSSYQQVRDARFAGVDPMPGLVGFTATGGRLNAQNTLRKLLGDVGDALAGARRTSLDRLGDRFIMPNTAIGDGSYGARDVDLYRFTASAGSTLTAVTAQPSSGAMDTFLRLFDAAGNPLAANDNSAGLYSRLDYTFATAGTYYVGVSGAGNTSYNPNVGGSGATGSTGDYRLDVSLDLGDTLVAATDTGLVVGGTYFLANTSIGDGSNGGRDVDLYGFTAPAGSTLTAATTRPSGGAAMDTLLRLFDAAGNAGYDPSVTGSGTPGSTGDYRLDLSLDVRSPAEFELSSLLGGDGSEGFVVSGTGPYSELRSPTLYGPVGDVNQDGYDDMILGAPGDIGTTSMTIGEVYLIFGKPGGFPTELDLHDLDGTTGYVIKGIALGDRTGFSGGGAGDINRDGIPDLVIGAIWATPSSDRVKAGQSYVLYGGLADLGALDLADGTEDGHIALVNLDGTHGFAINGIAADDNAGRPTGVGDLNHDGIDDLAIGAYGAGTSGEVYVLFGRDSTAGQSFPASFELSSLNGSNGFVIPALGSSDTLGIGVSGAGDVNGDGIADLIVGAYTADPVGRANAGQAYVIFGRSSFPASFNLATLNGSNGFTINGNAAGDDLGYSVDTAGDVNGDGVDDILIGAFGVDGSGKSDTGASYLIFGQVTATAGAFPAVLEVAALNGSNGIALQGTAAGDNAGYSVRGAGDVNDDGYDDLLIGAVNADPDGISSAGQSYVVYGAPNFAASGFQLASLLAVNGGDGSNGYALNGLQVGGQAYIVDGIGDLNADGIADLRVGAPYNDLIGVTAPGQVYIVFGKPSALGVRVMPPSGLATTEAGGIARFSVTLTAQPTADVTIPVSTSDATEGTITVSSLIFTSVNWNVPQTVTVTGVNDAYSDGDKAYAVRLGLAASADPVFNGLDPVDVSLVNTDNDIVTATFTKTENKSIPDKGTLTSSLGVMTAGTILDLDVKVNITHTNDADMDVFLIAPDGTRIELFTDVGGSGDNFTNTVLDDEAATSITAGSAPFTGTYKPEGNLTLLEGKSLAGTWKLEVTDDANSNTGKLLNWSITVRYGPTSLPMSAQSVASSSSPVLTAVRIVPVGTTARARWERPVGNRTSVRNLDGRISGLPGDLLSLGDQTLTLIATELIRSGKRQSTPIWPRARALSGVGPERS